MMASAVSPPNYGSDSGVTVMDMHAHKLVATWLEVLNVSDSEEAPRLKINPNSVAELIKLSPNHTSNSTSTIEADRYGR